MTSKQRQLFHVIAEDAAWNLNKEDKSVTPKTIIARTEKQVNRVLITPEIPLYETYVAEHILDFDYE